MVATTSMSAIISAQPLPKLPVVKDNPELDKYHRDMNDYLRRLAGLFTQDNLKGGGVVVGDGAGVVEMINYTWFSDSAIGAAHIITQSAPFSFTFNEVMHIASVGNLANLVFNINSVAITGSGDTTPNTTEALWTASSGNEVSVGDVLDFTIANNNVHSPGDDPDIAMFSIKITRT